MNKHEVIELTIDSPSEGVESLCTVYEPGFNEGGEGMANANLISAAPELIDALVDLLVFCRSHGMDNGFTEKSENAINKALGKEVTHA